MAYRFLYPHPVHVADADIWLTFALYHREAARSTEDELFTGQTSIPPDLVKKVDALVRQMAEEF